MPSSHQSTIRVRSVKTGEQYSVAMPKKTTEVAVVSRPRELQVEPEFSRAPLLTRVVERRGDNAGNLAEPTRSEPPLSRRQIIAQSKDTPQRKSDVMLSVDVRKYNALFEAKEEQRRQVEIANEQVMLAAETGVQLCMRQLELEEKNKELEEENARLKAMLKKFEKTGVGLVSRSGEKDKWTGRMMSRVVLRDHNVGYSPISKINGGVGL